MTYSLKPEIQEVLEKINFTERYKSLSKQFQIEKIHLKTMKMKKQLKYLSLLAIKLVL